MSVQTSLTANDLHSALSTATLCGHSMRVILHRVLDALTDVCTSIFLRLPVATLCSKIPISAYLMSFQKGLQEMLYQLWKPNNF